MTPTEGRTTVTARFDIDVHEQYAKPRVADRLLEDATLDLEAWLARRVAGAMLRAEAGAFVRPWPRGVLLTPVQAAVRRLRQRRRWRRAPWRIEGAPTWRGRPWARWSGRRAAKKGGRPRDGRRPEMTTTKETKRCLAPARKIPRTVAGQLVQEARHRSNGRPRRTVPPGLPR